MIPAWQRPPLYADHEVGRPLGHSSSSSSSSSIYLSFTSSHLEAIWQPGTLCIYLTSYCFCLIIHRQACIFTVLQCCVKRGILPSECRLLYPSLCRRPANNPGVVSVLVYLTVRYFRNDTLHPLTAPLMKNLGVLPCIT